MKLQYKNKTNKQTKQKQKASKQSKVKKTKNKTKQTKRNRQTKTKQNKTRQKQKQTNKQTDRQKKTKNKNKTKTKKLSLLQGRISRKKLTGNLKGSITWLNTPSATLDKKIYCAAQKCPSCNVFLVKTIVLRHNSNIKTSAEICYSECLFFNVRKRKEKWLLIYLKIGHSTMVTQNQW